MPAIKHPYGSPISDTSADSPKEFTANSTTKSGEPLPEPCSCSEQIAALKHQIAELEDERKLLTKSAVDANKRAEEAETRTVAAEAEQAAATQRAQARYKEKLLVHNENRHLKQDIEKKDAENRGHIMRIKITIDGLKADIMQLQSSKAEQAKENQAKVQNLEAQLDVLQDGFMASEAENVKLKKKFDNIITDLRNVIVKQQSPLEAVEKEKAAMKAELEKLQAKMNEDNKKFKAKESSLAKSIEELRKSESASKGQVKDLQERLNVSEDQVKAARQQTMAAQKEAQGARRQIKIAQEKAKQAIELAKQQSLKAAHNGLRTKQQQPQLLQQALGPNKKRKFGSNGNAALSTNGFQPMPPQAFVPIAPAPIQNTPRILNCVPMVADTPNGGHGQVMMPQSNVSFGPSTPARLQPQHYPQFPMSPQSGILPAQLGSPMSMPQQAHFAQTPQQHMMFPKGVASNNVEPLPQNNLSALQAQYTNFNLDFDVQLFQDIMSVPADPPLSNNMPQVNNANATFLPNTQDSGSMFNFDDSVTPNSSTMGTHNGDLFSDDIFGFSEDPSDATFQDQTQNGVPAPNMDMNAAQADLKRKFGEQ